MLAVYEPAAPGYSAPKALRQQPLHSLPFPRQLCAGCQVSVTGPTSCHRLCPPAQEVPLRSRRGPKTCPEAGRPHHPREHGRRAIRVAGHVVSPRHPLPAAPTRQEALALGCTPTALPTGSGPSRPATLPPGLGVQIPFPLPYLARGAAVGRAPAPSSCEPARPAAS